MKRSRGRGRRQQNPVNRSYDSNGPDVRVRGTASQVYEKYQALARDAMSAGDRVMAENYGQHAEHYYRIMLSLQPPPSEADKEAAANGEAVNGDIQNGDAQNGDGQNADAGDAGEVSAEPLILVRDGDEGEDKSAKPSRRRGPLRKKKTEATNEAQAEATSEAQADSQIEVTSEAADAAIETEVASAE